MSFPTVNTFVTVAVERTPTMFANVREHTTATMTDARPRPTLRAGMKYPRYPTNKLPSAAKAVTRASHINHPTSNPMRDPNAARAYR